MEEQESSLLMRGLTVLAVVVLMLLAAWGVYWLRSQLGAPAPHQKPPVQQIKLIKPPPPPKEKEQPPPPKQEKKVEVNQPKDQPKEAPKQAPPKLPSLGKLGLDAAGGAGSDAFGLVGNKGGQGLLGGGGSPYAAYSSQLKQDIFDQLSQRDDIRHQAYEVLVDIWITPSGTVRKVRLTKGSGNSHLDRKIESALSDIQSVGEAPPPGMPQPIRIRIVARL